MNFISLSSVQGYKVYQDPEGTRSLEQTYNHTAEITNKNNVTNDADDNYYKKRVLTLNEEIKALNDELAKVNTARIFDKVLWCTKWCRKVLCGPIL